MPLKIRSNLLREIEGVVESPPHSKKKTNQKGRVDGQGGARGGGGGCRRKRSENCSLVGAQRVFMLFSYFCSGAVGDNMDGQQYLSVESNRWLTR